MNHTILQTNINIINKIVIINSTDTTLKGSVGVRIEVFSVIQMSFLEYVGKMGIKCYTFLESSKLHL